MTDFTWTDARVEELKSSWADGLSASQCADELYQKFGAMPTRNAIIGKVHRLGLEGRKKIAFIRYAKPKSSRPRKPPTFQSPPMAIIPTCEPVTFDQLNNNHCRYITSGEGRDALFCGADKEPGISYCSHHAQLCFAGHVTLGAAEAEIRRRLMARKARAA